MLLMEVITMTNLIFIMAKLMIQDLLEVIRIVIIVIVELILTACSVFILIATFYALNKQNTDIPFMIAGIFLELTVEIVFMKEVEEQIRKIPRGF